MISVKTQGFDTFITRLQRSTAVKRNITTAIRNAVTVITIAAKANVPRGATGDLSRSIMQQVDEREMVGIVGLDYPGRTYGIYVEKGTGPHWVPIDALKRWADQRGISPYAVQYAIARKGTKAQPFLMPAYERNRRYISDQFRKALKNVTYDLTHGN